MPAPGFEPGPTDQESGKSPSITVRFTLEVAGRGAEGVGFAVIAAWLYDSLKGHVHPERGGEKLIIERTELELEQGVITRVLTEKLTSEMATQK